MLKDIYEISNMLEDICEMIEKLEYECMPKILECCDYAGFFKYEEHRKFKLARAPEIKKSWYVKPTIRARLPFY